MAERDFGGKDGWCQSPEFARIGLSVIMLGGEGGGVKVKGNNSGMMSRLSVYVILSTLPLKRGGIVDEIPPVPGDFIRSLSKGATACGILRPFDRLRAQNAGLYSPIVNSYIGEQVCLDAFETRFGWRGPPSVSGNLTSSARSAHTHPYIGPHTCGKARSGIRGGIAGSSASV